MIFDVACKIAERTVHNLRPYLREAAVFKLEGNPEEFTQIDYDDEAKEFYMENFMLPMPVTAIEDNASLVILFELSQNKDEDIIGAEHARGFIEIIDLSRARLNAFTDSPAGASLPDIPRNTVEIHYGAMSIPEMGERLIYHGAVESVVVATPERIIFNKKGKELPEAQGAVLKNVGVAWQQVMYLNTPGRYVVEDDKVDRKPPQKSRMIPRTHERARYTIMYPHEIRKKMELSEHTDRTQTPHWRRRHFRRLTSDRFVNKKGKVIAVRQAWIGPTEQVVGNRRYKVLLHR